MPAPKAQQITPSSTADPPLLTNHNAEATDKAETVTITPAGAHKVPLLPSTTLLNCGDAPTTVCGHLQLLFGQLQYSFRRFIYVHSSKCRRWVWGQMWGNGRDIFKLILFVCLFALSFICSCSYPHIFFIILFKFNNYFFLSNCLFFSSFVM